MMEPIKRCLVDLLASLTNDDASGKTRTQAIHTAIRESRMLLGMPPLSEEDIQSHLLATCGEFLGDHCQAHDLDSFSLDLVDEQHEENGPFVLVSINKEMTGHLKDLLDEAESSFNDNDDTDEDDAVGVNVPAPGTNWEN